MEQIFPGIYTWSWYSEEKGIYFNGHLVAQGGERLLIDPPPISLEDQQDLSVTGIDMIVLTNRDHVRNSMEYRSLFCCKIWAPFMDVSGMVSATIDHTFNDGNILPGGLKVVSIPDGKSPGESALYLNQHGGIFILGDALIGKPDGELNLLPNNKFADVKKAGEGLLRLLDYSFDAVLVGDGKSILSDGKKAVERCLQAIKTRSTP